MNLQINQLETLKQHSKSVVLIWAEGCHACAAAKPAYEALAPKFKQFAFHEMQFSPDILPFYNQYIPKAPAMEQATSPEGHPLTNPDSTPILRPKLDATGNPILESPIAFPNFLVFLNGFADASNEHGFAGNIPGANIPQLEFVLDKLTDPED